MRDGLPYMSLSKLGAVHCCADRDAFPSCNSRESPNSRRITASTSRSHPLVTGATHLVDTHVRRQTMEIILIVGLFVGVSLTLLVPALAGLKR